MSERPKHEGFTPDHIDDWNSRLLAENAALRERHERLVEALTEMLGTHGEPCPVPETCQAVKNARAALAAARGEG